MKNRKWRTFLIPVGIAILLQSLGEMRRIPAYRVSAIAFFAGEYHVNLVGDKIFHGTVSEPVGVGELISASRVHITD